MTKCSNCFSFIFHLYVLKGNLFSLKRGVQLCCVYRRYTVRRVNGEGQGRRRGKPPHPLRNNLSSWLGPFVYLEQKHPSFLRNMYYVCSYAASIGGELTGGSVINSMIKIRKGIPYYPKIAHRLSESVLGDVLSTLQIYRN